MRFALKRKTCFFSPRQSEVSSREYLISSDERVRLQCELMFGGELLKTVL